MANVIFPVFANYTTLRYNISYYNLAYRKENLYMVQTTTMLSNMLDGCILLIIKNKACNLKEIINDLRRHGFKDVDEGMVYPILLKIETEGLFHINKMSPDEGPIRKYYSLTEKGKLKLCDYQAAWSNLRVIIDNLMEVYTVYENR